jgi:opacity protein-like surface antigen
MRSVSGVARGFVFVAVLVLAMATASAPPAHSQPLYNHKGTFFIGGGINSPIGETNPYLNSSGSFSFGGGRNLNQANALLVEYTHHWLAVDPEVIDRAQNDSTTFENVHASLWSITLNLVHRFHADSDIVPWLTLGGGYYKRNILLTQNALIYYPPIYDPWWGWIDGGWGPGEAITGQHTSTGFGFNVGGGIDLAMEGGTAIFLEARYHMAFMEGVDMQLIPVMAGVRW